MRKIKLIWDFHGPDAEGIAKHHVIHLKEFAEREMIQTFGFGEKNLTDSHVIAFMVVLEKDMITVRDLLRPHRGEVFEEN